MRTWYDRDDNVYDKFNAPKCLWDCMLSVELKHLPLASLTRVLPQGPGRIEYYICLCGHFGVVSEIPHWMFQNYLRVTKN